MIVKSLHYKGEGKKAMSDVREYLVFTDMTTDDNDFASRGFELHCTQEVVVPDCYPIEEILMVNK